MQVNTITTRCPTTTTQNWHIYALTPLRSTGLVYRVKDGTMHKVTTLNISRYSSHDMAHIMNLYRKNNIFMCQLRLSLAWYSPQITVFHGMISPSTGYFSLFTVSATKHAICTLLFHCFPFIARHMAMCCHHFASQQLAILSKSLISTEWYGWV